VIVLVVVMMVMRPTRAMKTRAQRARVAGLRGRVLLLQLHLHLVAMLAAEKVPPQSRPLRMYPQRARVAGSLGRTLMLLLYLSSWTLASGGWGYCHRRPSPHLPSRKKRPLATMLILAVHHKSRVQSRVSSARSFLNSSSYIPPT
jgi:hypothetical protein